ncbi:BQ2448_4098 [Microbotryum intermedium]|uniref:N-acetylglucosaminylphosphatidylinositol deacetylase n=1 Tax=Microbotryum intermedium TaxID=269621 RepID=A0A238FK93_9BASI|nr:BQ2448_4098 [Microbotryum intermedium]
MIRLRLGQGVLSAAIPIPRQRWSTSSKSNRPLPSLVRLAVGLLFLCYQLSVVSAAVFSCVGGTVYVVAHPDDDLLFQSPDLWTDIVSGACVTTIFLTSGDSGVGLTYAKSRESGNEAANSYMANVDDTWTEFVATFGGQPVLVRTLVGAPQVQRVWFRLPDGNVDGTGYAPNGYQSLRGLYFGSISSISSLDGGATFTLATLKEAISDILTARQAKNVRTLDYLSDYDAGDHSDHITTARITSALVGNTAPSANVAGYMGYTINNFAPTLTTGSAQFVAKSDAFFQYTPYDSSECQSYSVCSSAGRGEAYWLVRQYVVTSALAQQSYTGSAESPVTMPNGTNIARIATANASSYAGPTQVPSRAIDGIVSGYPGNSSAEWVSDGGRAGTTFTLTWSEAYSITSIVLFDRPNANDWAKGGTITFADGRSVPFGALANDGSATLVTLSQTVVTDSLVVKFTSVSAATGSVGLAEIQVFGTLCSECQDSGGIVVNSTAATSAAFSDLALLAQATASSEANGQTADRANDGVISGYPSNWTAEWSTKGQGVGAWLYLTWPQSLLLDSLVFYDRPNLNDWITGGKVTFDDDSSVTIPSLNNDGSATIVNLTKAVDTTSLLFTVTGAGPSSGSVGLAELAVFYSQTQVAGVGIDSNTTTNTTSVTTSDTTTTDAFADLAPSATASASSGASGQTADRANDGVISGYPLNWTAEWATQGQGSGAWLKLVWARSYSVDSLVFYDRPNLADWITGGEVTFDDGSSVTVPSLNNDGSATVVNLTAAVNTTSLLFTVTSAAPSSSSVGLAELGVFCSQAQGSGTTGTYTPLTSTTTTSLGTVGSSDAYSDLALTAFATASSGTSGQTADRANDGVISGYPSNWTAEWATQGEESGAWLNLTWSSLCMVDSLVFYDRPNTNDWITGGTVAFSDGTTIPVPSLNNDGSATVVNLTSAVRTSSLLFIVTSVGPSTGSAGLAELGVFYSKSQTPVLAANMTYVQSNNTATTSNSTSAIISATTDTSVDLALNATATASSSASGQGADKANDGNLSGYKEDGSGDWQQEWASQGETVGAWLTLTWPSNVEINEVILYDRPNLDDQITAGTLTFSTGAVVSFGALVNNGSAVSIALAQPIIASTLTMTVTEVSSSSSNIGLSEIMVYRAVPDNTSTNATISTNSTLTNSTVVTSSAIGAINVNSTLANSTIANSTLNDSTLGNSTLGNSTLGNSTLGNSTLGDSTLGDSTLGDSTLGDSTLGDSTLGDSTLGNLTLSNSTLSNSTLSNSTLSNSTLANSTSANSTLANSTFANSALGNLTLANTTLGLNSTVTNATLSDSPLADNSSLANSTSYNSTVTDATLANSTLANSALGNLTLANTTLGLNSTVTNATLSDSPLADNSSLANSTSYNSTVTDATLANSTLANSASGNLTLANTTLGLNSTFTNATLSDSTLADNSSLANSTSYNSSVSNSTLVNSTLANSTLDTNSTLSGNASLPNSTLYNSTLANSTVANSTIGNATLINSTLVNSTNGINSTLTNATSGNLTIPDSTMGNPTLGNSTLSNSTFVNSTLTTSTAGTDSALGANPALSKSTFSGNTSLTNSTSPDSTLANSTLGGSTLANSTLVDSTSTNSTLTDSTTSANSTLGTNSTSTSSSATGSSSGGLTTDTSPMTMTSATTSATAPATTTKTVTTTTTTSFSPSYSPQPTGSLRSYATYNNSRVTAGTVVSEVIETVLGRLTTNIDPQNAFLQSLTTESTANACGLRCDRTQCTAFDWKAATKECWTHTDKYPFGGNSGNTYISDSGWTHYVPGVCASYTALAGSVGSACFQYQVVAPTKVTSSSTASQKTTTVASPSSKVASSSLTSNWASSSESSSASSASSSAPLSVASSATSLPSMTTVTRSSTTSTSSTTSSSAATTTTGLATAPPPNVNIARLSGVMATASSYRASSPPSGVNDGVIGGLALDGSGNATEEWSTGTGTVPAWIQLQWPQSCLIKTVVLFPPVNLVNAVRAGILTFSDGSTANVGVLSPLGTQINLGAGRTTSSLRFTITVGAPSRNAVGIAEMRAYNAPPATTGVLGGTIGVV